MRPGRPSRSAAGDTRRPTAERRWRRELPCRRLSYIASIRVLLQIHEYNNANPWRWQQLSWRNCGGQKIHSKSSTDALISEQGRAEKTGQDKDQRAVRSTRHVSVPGPRYAAARFPDLEY
uniref:Uncharacterized protein n=1 Tax=Oryza nivara TaxID=4536 RepID=A0A0E0IWP2_ORYNI